MQTEFFQGEGEVRKLLREFDWASSRVGVPESWPCELHTLMDMILQVQYPAVVLWGEDNSYWYNDAYIYLLGQRHPAALGQRFRDVWPELWPEIGPTIESTMAGVPAYFECVPFTCSPNGVPEERFFTLSFSPVRDRSGKVLGMLNAGFETTNRIAEERRIAQAEEDARRLAEDLARENRRKSEFLAVLAHELRNPLAPIRTGLEIIRMRSDNPDAVMRVRDMIERQTSHMIHLIDDLLDVARITTGKIELKKSIVDLNEIVASAVETSLPAIENAHHELRLNLHDGPLLLEADEVRIGQVIGNLLTNAAKYTPQGGKISLSVTREGDEAVVAVSDSGIGIPPEALETVFDMFNQIERSLAHSQGGLGIGLSLVRQLASLHGGSATAASEGEGKGSTFTVRLPVKSSPQSAMPGPEKSLAPGDRPKIHRILVVDDNADAANSLAGLLRLRGHDIRVAYSGAEAIALAQVFQPDLAFLDIGMPDMSGYDVARRLRKEPGLERMTIAALTGWGTDDDRARSADAGFDAHLTKPMTSASLDALLAKVSRSAQSSESSQ